LFINIWLLKRQFQFLVYACRQGWEVSYLIADAEKSKNGGKNKIPEAWNLTTHFSKYDIYASCL
jgi:hypothetical protein